MADHKTKLGVLYRAFEIDRASIDAAARTVWLSFSSEHPVRRHFKDIGDFNEVLDHNPKSVRLERAKSGAAPLLVNHDPNDLIGVVEEVEISPDKRGRAKVRFGSSPRAEEIWNDVKSGIRSAVSAGYRVWDAIVEKVGQGLETLRATDWELLEISFAPIAHDYTVGVGRGATLTDENEITIRSMNKPLLDAQPPTSSGGAPVVAPPPVQSRAEILREVQVENAARMKEINALAATVGTDEARSLALKAIEDNTPVNDFKGLLLERCFKAKPVATPDNAEVGLTKKEIRQYSLVRAMNCIANKQPVDGLEKEASDQVAKNIGRRPQGFFIPADVTTRSFAESKDLTARDMLNVIAGARALTSNVFTAGGALVGTDLLAGSLIELLRNAMHVMALGARNLTGLVGDVAIPKHTGGATAYWLAQGAALTRSQQTVAQLGLTPHRLAAATAYDKQLLAQSSLSVEAFVREDLMATLAIEKDRAAINGSGVAGEPLGILNTTGLSTTVTLATASAPIFTEVIKFETNLAANNADSGNLAYLVTPAVRGHAKGYPKFASTGTPIWEDDMMNGYPARATNQVPTASPMIFGKWSDLIIADWDGMDVVVDPYSLSLNGQISIVIQTLTDLGIRNPVSFAKGINP